MSKSQSSDDAVRTMTIVRGNALSVPTVRLRFTPPSGSPMDIPLGLRPLVVGSSDACDVVLAEDRGISREHCQITLTTRGIRLEDLNSKNGTFIGNLRIMDCILPSATNVTIGRTTFVASTHGDPYKIRLSASTRFGGAIGRSASMRAVFAVLEDVASSVEHVILWGEAGSGKRTLAEALHLASSRKTGPFVIMDSLADDPATLETQFHELVQQSRGGTLYVHEPQDLPSELQIRIARTFESVMANTRLVLGMREDPAAAVKRRAIVAELFSPKLSFVNLPIFPLRQRREDIRPLVEFFLTRQGSMTVDSLPMGTIDMLEKHSWPGNVAQLEDIIEEIAQRVTVGEGLLKALMGANAAADGDASIPNASLGDAREAIVNAFEKMFIKTNLRRNQGHVTRTAAALGISRQMLHRLMSKYGLQNRK